MNLKLIQELIQLRVSVGYLGESDQKGWWKSSFFSQSSLPFLTPVFGKTANLAQYHGVKESAAIIHDERIGVGSDVYHLFRLPEIVERELQKTLLEGTHGIDMSGIVSIQDAADSYLESFAVMNDNLTVEGPLRVGDKASIQSSVIWKKVAGLYLQAMRDGIEIFPYFS